MSLESYNDGGILIHLHNQSKAFRSKPPWYFRSLSGSCNSV